MLVVLLLPQRVGQRRPPPELLSFALRSDPLATRDPATTGTMKQKLSGDYHPPFSSFDCSHDVVVVLL